MSRELLKRVITECSDEGSRSNITPKLYGAIAEYLEMPEPEPVAWAIFRKGNMYDFSRTQPGEELLGQMGDYAIPVYTIPPDQSAQIAALKHELQQAEEDYVSVEEAYLQCQKDLYDETEKLAALQAREPLSIDEIAKMWVTSTSDVGNSTIHDYALFARAIEAAHGIGVNHE